MDKEIKNLRSQIDAIDLELLQLLNRRAALAQQIGELKKELQSPIFHPQRENQVIEALSKSNPGPIKDESIAPIWREIMSACRALEQTIRVAFLGPQGTFTEEAAISYFGCSVEFEPCNDIDAIFKAVSNGNCRFGVVPVENSTEGVVTRSLDLLQQEPLKIVGEVSLRVRHQLLALQNDLHKITTVYAHPQALAQCQNWLTQHIPHAKRQAVSSNAEGARLASMDPTAAAIASERTAGFFQLHVVMPGIQDVSSNRTRFVILAQKEELQPPYSDDDISCTSIVVSVPNIPGAVHDLLAPLKAHKVSLTRFESRPAKSDQWEYFFYMDVVGHASQPSVAKALEDVRQICTFYKVLGSYFVRRELA